MPVSGLRGIHQIPLGSHLCLFYRRPKEFLRVTASFLKAGLTNHELCVWILPSPLNIQLAVNELWRYGLDGDRLQATRQLQIITADECWFSPSPFDVERSLRSLVALVTLARQLGYASVRAVGGPGPFLSERSRQAFMRYEHHATSVIAEHSCIGLCCYSSAQSLATDMFDIMNAHPKALLQTPGGWAKI